MSKKSPDITWRVIRVWSFEKAEYEYAVTKTTQWPDAETTSTVARGGQAWAEANAKHLGVEIEEGGDA